MPLHAVRVLRDVGIDFAVSAFEVGIRHQPRPAVTRSGNVDDIEIVFIDDAVQMDIDKVQPWCRAPMAEQTRLDVRQLEWLLQQWIVVEINLADREVVCRAPIGVQLAQQIRAESLCILLCFHRSTLLGVTRSGSLCIMPCTTRCPTAMTEMKTCCFSSQSTRKATAEP